MKIQSYSYLIASSLASGLIAFSYYPSEQFPSHETTSTCSCVVELMNQECSKTALNQMSALSVQPELSSNWGFPARFISAASR